MAFFPFRRDDAASDALLDRLRNGADRRGYGFVAAEIESTGECIGFVGIEPTDLEPWVRAGGVEIGWRLAPEFWGRGYATEAARAWLDFGFDQAGLDEIWSFAVAGNGPSIAVMKRIGMRQTAEFDHPGIPDTHPDLRRHVLYRIGRDEGLQPARRT